MPDISKDFRASQCPRNHPLERRFGSRTDRAGTGAFAQTLQTTAVAGLLVVWTQISYAGNFNRDSIGDGAIADLQLDGASDQIFLDGFETPAAACSGITLPPGIVSLSQQVWTERYGAQFPLQYSTNRLFSIGTGTGLAIAMTATVPQGGNGNGSLVFSEFGSVPRAGFMTISECPGDFRLDVLNVPPGCTANCTNRCHTGAEAVSNPNLSFRTTSHATNACNLVEGREYFINVHYGSTSEPAADGSYCAGAICTMIGGTSSFFREARALKWLDSGDLVGLQARE